jgi:hypothetical protein
VKIARPLLPRLGVRGQPTSPTAAAPTRKDVIAAGAQPAWGADRRRASRGGAVAVAGPHGPAQSARLVGTTHSRSAGSGRGGREQTGRSSQAGRTAAASPPRLFRASAYPRCRQTPRRTLRRAGPWRAAEQGPDDAAGSGALAPGGAAGRGRSAGTSAAPASAANGWPLAGSQRRSSGPAAVPGGRGGHSP